VALAVAGPTAAGAQRAAEVLPAGARVQLFFPGRAAEARGELMRPGGDTLWVRYDGAPDTAASGAPACASCASTTGAGRGGSAGA
jgi:hypothetical protein